MQTKRPTKRSYPRWRHWHVEGHDFGYTLREAREVSNIDAPFWGGACARPYRCDVDHSA